MMRPGISSTSTNSGRFPRSGRTPATAPAPGSLRGRGCRTFRTTAYGNPYTGKGEPERGRGSPPPRRRLSTWGALGHGRCVPNGSTGKCEQGFCRPRSAGGTGGIVPRPRGGDTPGRSRERESDATRCGEPVPAPVQDFRQGPRLPSFSAGSTSGAQRARACPHAGQQCVRHRGIRCTRDSADTCGALGHGGRRVIPGARRHRTAVRARQVSCPPGWHRRQSMRPPPDSPILGRIGGGAEVMGGRCDLGIIYDGRRPTIEHDGNYALARISSTRMS